MTWILAGAAFLAAGVSELRWLRVAQREHYLLGVSRFARMWWGRDVRNRMLLAVALLSAVVASRVTVVGFAAVAIGLVGPLGLAVRGRTSALAWTGRLRRLAAVVTAITLGATAPAAMLGIPTLVATVPLAVPVLVDIGLRLVAGYERRQGDRWVRQAAASLSRIDPTIVAITGSYGKTSTKNIVAHLLGGVRSVTASPASFNNRLGLARAVNESLTPGTDVFVAEMGTYGPGEIRDLCEWVPPDVAVITALGPVHLERMGSVERIAAAKREILDRAPVAVVSVDHPLLAAIAGEESGRRKVITVSGEGATADVVTGPDGGVLVGGALIGTFSSATAHPGNVACAVGVLLALGVDPGRAAERLRDLPDVPHRRTIGRSERGFDIVDDTFNSNPAGAESALELLARQGSSGGRKVVVSPGMVELGERQRAANHDFAAAAGRSGVTDFVVVNRTNRQALVAGARAGGVSSIIVLDTRDDAVRWVRETLVEGDAVLYENDLPDHYP
jgi:UDP-N-acetylmuramoyl-tripeptide--D-alanyl-D-alanine ligase